MSAQWTATSSHSLTCEFSSPPTYWIGLPTWASSGSRRGYSDWTLLTGPGEPPQPGPKWPLWPPGGPGSLREQQTRQAAGPDGQADQPHHREIGGVAEQRP